MALHKETVVKLDLPNGVQATLPSYCADALTVEIVKVPGKLGDEFAVGVKVVDMDSSGVDPRENDDGFGEFKEFRTTEKMDDFLRTCCKEDYQAAAVQAGWKVKEDGRLCIDGDTVDVANDWEEACDISECALVLVPEKLMFMVDKYEHGLVQYKASGRDVGLDDHGVGVFIPCGDVQDRYQARLKEGMSVADARAEALADTNRGLEEFSAWCNGEVYGILDYRFDAQGERLDEGEEVWGFIGSDYADEELADRLFGARVEAKADALGLDADKQQNINPMKSEFIGNVLEVDKSAGVVIQATGAGHWVAHHLSNFKQVPEVGNVASIKYKGGDAVAAGMEQAASKDIER